jgi:hypothetical protein
MVRIGGGAVRHPYTYRFRASRVALLLGLG